ncbi:molybdate ABC transporter permease subunit [Paenibacillus sp. P26]|nr:molybdate ABC transporter permease subunit [Paenibacillus sp. P26]
MPICSRGLRWMYSFNTASPCFIDYGRYELAGILDARQAVAAGCVVLQPGRYRAWRGGGLVDVPQIVSREDGAGDGLYAWPLVLPPTVVGFVLLVLLGRKSWMGQLIEWLFAAPVIFSWWVAVIASIVVAFPLVYQTMKVGFSSVDRDLEGAARSMGAGEWQVFRYITLPLTVRSLVSAYILGFARGLGEFGATLMIAGNIPGKTQTLPTAIYVAVDAGHTTMAWAWTGSMIVISFLMLAGYGQKKRVLLGATFPLEARPLPIIRWHPVITVHEKALRAENSAPKAFRCITSSNPSA